MIPNGQQGFEELQCFETSKRISSRRERVLAKILVDVHMLCVVDVALALQAALLALEGQERQVLVIYAGADHVRKQELLSSFQLLESIEIR